MIISKNSSVFNIINRLLTKAIYSALFVFIFISINAFSQQNPLFISIDRGIYIAGERIKVNIGLLNEKGKDPIYVYCDLIGQDGSHFSGLKLKMISQTIDFDFDISDNLISGYYALRVYTSSMSLHSGDYPVAVFKVVNPESTEILQTDNISTLSIQDDTLIKMEKGIDISLNKMQYAKRELVEVNLKIDSNIIDPITATFSVVPKHSFISYRVEAVKQTVPNLNESASSLQLQGRLYSKKSKSPIPNQRIYFSVVNSNDIMSALTDSFGNYAVHLPDYYGNHELIISPEENNADFDIRVEKEFDLKNTIYLNKEFLLDTNEQKLALNLAQNLFVEKVFSDNKPSEKASILGQKVFYNKPDQIIRIMDYVDMPILAMYFTELSGAVHLNKKNGIYEIRIIDNNGIQLLQKPLLMVDNVAVSDLEFILKLDPKSINRIEIVNTYYQKGDASFGGIVNFISNNLDFGGISFPESSVSINYQFLERTYALQQAEITNARQPDARNTLSFINTLRTKNIIYFYTADFAGEYQIIVQGFNKKGERKIFYSSFKVLEK